MAWGDFDGNDLVDVVFVARGELKGLLHKYPGIVNDELLFNEDGHFRNRAAQSGIDKDGCPARQAAAVDFDNDNRLDIYVVCGRDEEPSRDHPNQLYHQETNGEFRDVAKAKGLDLPGEGAFLWLDVDGDQDVDLLWVTRDQIALYRNNSGSFSLQPVAARHGHPRKLTIADYDADGDFDVFLVSTTRNTLLTNTGGSFMLTDPGDLGLPVKSLTANWVDYDNDGRMDLHTLPNGLYRQRPDHTFEATNLLINDNRWLRWSSPARCTWFDFDNDGFRDLVMYTKNQPRRRTEMLLGNVRVDDRQFLRLYRNTGNPNHWLQVQLIGPRGNRQAIGARVEVTTPKGVQTQQVGQADGSHYSLGHYRLYFGLGKQIQVDAVRIFWPDGHLQVVRTPLADQLLTVSRERDFDNP